MQLAIEEKTFGGVKRKFLHAPIYDSRRKDNIFVKIKKQKYGILYLICLI